MHNDDACVRVLLIEDDHDHAALIESAFDEHPAKWRLATAQSLEEGRRRMAESPPDLIIVDFMLPDGKGTQLLPLHRDAVTIPIVLMTSHGNEAVAVEAMKSGALDYVVKSSFSLADMPRIAERALREWGLLVSQARAKERERQLTAELAHAERRNTMGEIASYLAHELNQPLTAISNYAGACAAMLRRNETHMDVLSEAMAEIDRQSRRAGEMINRLKRFISGASPHLTVVDLNELIREVVGLMGSTIQGHETALDVLVESPVSSVRVDAIQIQQILVNLIQNSLDAMAEIPSENRRIALKVEQRGDAVVIGVADRGRGISHEMQDQVFDPYFTTKPGHLGMGLCICRRIADRHGGSLTHRPNPSGGTIFELSLPLARGKVERRDAPLDHIESGTPPDPSRGR